MYMSIREAKKLMASSNLIDKKGVLWKFYYFFSLYIKMNDTTYYQRNRGIILNRATITMKMIKKD